MCLDGMWVLRLLAHPVQIGGDDIYVKLASRRVQVPPEGDMMSAVGQVASHGLMTVRPQPSNPLTSRVTTLASGKAFVALDCVQIDQTGQEDEASGNLSRP